MEQLLGYIWKHRFYDAKDLRTTTGEQIEVVDRGIENTNAGPDFFQAKIKINGTLWVGCVEIHERASDWHKHGHTEDPAYDNVILHVVEQADETVYRTNGEVIPQLVLQIPEQVINNMEWLLSQDTMVACREMLSVIAPLYQIGWLDALLGERLQRKVENIQQWLELYNQDWNEVFYVLLCRNFGFGINGDAFERLARSLPLKCIQKQRGSSSQIEALFLGQAGLLEAPYRNQHHYYRLLQQEYQFLRYKYNLKPLDAYVFKTMRLRPNATPHLKLVQLAAVWVQYDTLFSAILEARTPREIKDFFRVTASEFWDTHYQFQQETSARKKSLGENSLNILLINTVVPMMFAYGHLQHKPEYCERALKLLERIPPEKNYIVTTFQGAGIKVNHAGDTQALIQLMRNYCEPKRCLYCRFAFHLLKQS